MVGDLWNTIRHQSLPDSLPNDLPPSMVNLFDAGGYATGTFGRVIRTTSKVQLGVIGIKM